MCNQEGIFINYECANIEKIPVTCKILFLFLVLRKVINTRTDVYHYLDYHLNVQIQEKQLKYISCLYHFSLSFSFSYTSMIYMDCNSIHTTVNVECLFSYSSKIKEHDSSSYLPKLRTTFLPLLMHLVWNDYKLVQKWSINQHCGSRSSRYS